MGKAPLVGQAGSLNQMHANANACKCRRSSISSTTPAAPARPPRRTAPGCRSAGRRCAGPAPVEQGGVVWDQVHAMHLLQACTNQPSNMLPTPCKPVCKRRVHRPTLFDAPHLLWEGEDRLRVDHQAGGRVRRLPNLYEAVQASADDVALPHLRANRSRGSAGGRPGVARAGSVPACNWPSQEARQRPTITHHTTTSNQGTRPSSPEHPHREVCDGGDVAAAVRLVNRLPHRASGQVPHLGCGGHGGRNT